MVIYELLKKLMSLYGFKNFVIDMCIYLWKWSEYDLKLKL